MAAMMLHCALIVLARVADVSLGTMRTIMVVQGRRTLALVLGFFEILIWISVVSSVVTRIHEPQYAAAYALGFALGNYVGMTIEQKLAMGRQVVRFITRQGPELAVALRNAGLIVTQFDGYGRDGPVQELFVESERRSTPRIIAQARTTDPKCYYTVDDVRMTSSVLAQANQPTGWRSILKKK